MAEAKGISFGELMIMPEQGSWQYAAGSSAGEGLVTSKFTKYPCLDSCWRLTVSHHRTRTRAHTRTQTHSCTLLHARAGGYTN